MSAESPHFRSEMRSPGPRLITPQPVTDPSILDNVAGFITDVVPTSYNSLPQDTKDQIQWAHFEQLEPDETITTDHDSDKIVPPAMVLVLGYPKGVQVWGISANGDAQEVFAWRHGAVRVLRLLPNPCTATQKDLFAGKRPLIGMSEGGTPAQSSSVAFMSLKTGEQVQCIKFQDPVVEVMANRKSVVIIFAEKIAVFDACTLEDRLTVTTCYVSHGVTPNPIALGTRWMAYAEMKRIPAKCSQGGNEGVGVHSYTATVLHAAAFLGRGLRELGETVASSLTGNHHGTSPNNQQQCSAPSDALQKGMVTVMDIENGQLVDKNGFPDAIVAHFAAHKGVIVCLQFDPSGMLLLTADNQGHDFHLFRIHPHPAGPALAAVHHLYVLHRGDTSAKVQDMCFSPDSRWVAVSTLRGTTHVFPITPYGGNVGLRTHGTPHVVNKMSRFHRSAGLTAEGRSNSPVSLIDVPVAANYPYNNPRYPPFAHPTIIQPLAQIRQPLFTQNIRNVPQSTGNQRQRLSSQSEDNIRLRLATCFAPPRAWLDSAPLTRDTPTAKAQNKSIEALFVMSCNGCLIQYDLDPRHCTSIPKERVCDDSPIELGVAAKAQWLLQRRHDFVDVPLPLSMDRMALVSPELIGYRKSKPDHNDDSWLAQVEIVTHAGPHRRLWMGPQFTFKTYTTSNGSPLSMASMAEALPIDLRRSKPVNMPITKANAILIESSSASSYEQSLLDNFHKTDEEPGAPCEIQLKEDLADAMQESNFNRGDQGGRCVIVSMKPQQPVAKVVNPLGTVVTLPSDEEEHEERHDDDVVILENCDEALFRPVVTPKSVPYTEYKHSPDNIITKSLEGTTEVTVKILEKTPPKVVKPTPTKPVVQKANNKKKDVVKEIKEVVPTPKAVPKPIPVVVPEPESVPVPEILHQVVEIPVPQPLDSTVLDLDLDLVKEDYFGTIVDDFFDPPPPLPALELQNPTVNHNDFIAKDEDLLMSDESKFGKKQRKPKAKLGVKIAAVNKENLDNLEVNVPNLPLAPVLNRKSWSSIASANKPNDDKILIDTLEQKLEPIEQFTVTLPQKTFHPSIMEDLINIDTPEEEHKTTDSLLSKMDKSSDDEKPEPEPEPESANSNSSPTESDDSGKLQQEADPDAEDQVVTTAPISRASKRKMKKKRK